MRRIFVFLLLGGVACSDAVLPAGGERIAPEPHWTAIWQGVETCSGHHGAFSRVTFIRYDQSTIPGYGAAIALAIRGKATILLAEQVADDGVLAHEMLHLLIPESGHPPKYAKACPQVAGWP